MSVAELPIQIDREQIARFCQERGIRKLSLFGSVLRHDFDPRQSDVDVLAEFEPGVLEERAGFQYFAGVWRELAAILGAQGGIFTLKLHPLIMDRVKDESCFPCMSAHDADLTLKQIVEVCDRAIELRNSMTWEEFRGDWRKQMLGERLVEVLGEASQAACPMICAPGIRKCLGTRSPATRDYIAHGYDSVDYDVIWGVLDVEAGKLKAAVLVILAKEFPEPPAG